MLKMIGFDPANIDGPWRSIPSDDALLLLVPWLQRHAVEGAVS